MADINTILVDIFLGILLNHGFICLPWFGKYIDDDFPAILRCLFKPAL